MKKIISLIAAVAMFATMSITSFAASATIELENGSLEVAAGTQDIELDLSFTMSESAEVSAIAFTFDLPTGVSIASYNSDAFKALCDTTVTDDSALPTLTFYEDDMTTPISGTVTIPVTFTVDTTAATVYTIGFDMSNTMIADPDGNPYNGDVPSATITVAAGEKDDPTVVESTKDEAGENDLITKGYLVEVTSTADTKSFNGITITAAANGKTADPVEYTFAEMKAGTVKVAVNVLNVPADKTVDFSYDVITVE